MHVVSGEVLLNGVDDEILAIAFKFKAEHEGLFNFIPQQMSPTAIPGQGKNRAGYNGMKFGGASPKGLKKVIELLQKIDHHHSEPKAG